MRLTAAPICHRSADEVVAVSRCCRQTADADAVIQLDTLCFISQGGEQRVGCRTVRERLLQPSIAQSVLLCCLSDVGL